MPEAQHSRVITERYNKADMRDLTRLSTTGMQTG